MPKLVCYHVDTCLACYYNYAHRYVVAVSVDNQTTYAQLQQACKDEALSNAYEAFPDSWLDADILAAISEMFSTVSDMASVFDSALPDAIELEQESVNVYIAFEELN